MSFLKNVVKLVNPAAGSADTRSGRVGRTGVHRTTPWVETTDDAIYTGLNKQVWMYRVVENLPLFYDDINRQVDHGRSIATLLADIGRTSIAAPPGFPSAPAGFYRNLHVMTVRWYEQSRAPQAMASNDLRAYVEDELLTFTSPRQTVFLGVQLSTLDGEAAARNSGPLAVMSQFIDTASSDDPTDHDRLAKDREFVHRILANNGCRIPTNAEMRQLEAWFNHGSHAEPEIIPHPDHLIIDRQDKLEFAALERFNRPRAEAPSMRWLSGVMDHEDGPNIVSIRMELQPAADTRKSLRRSLSRRDELEDERLKSGQRERTEETTDRYLAEAAEAMYSAADAPVSLRNVSIVFGHRNEGYSHETYMDFLRNTFSIDVKPLTHRQIAALEETMPCAQRRANTFPQHLSTEVISYAGLGMFTELGDETGAMVGRGLPDGTPVYYDIMAASRNNSPPATFIAGVPGSGKTLLALNICFQSALAGHRVAFVNPKGDDSLYSMVEFMEARGIETEWVSISQLTETGGEGTFDPFRYARTQETAALIASNLITTVIDFDQQQRTALRHGLTLGAKTPNVRSVMQALQLVTDEYVVQQVMHMWEATPLMRLALGMAPRPRTDRDDGGVGKFTLIEFDTDMNLPTTVKESYSDAERIGLAVVRAVTTANIGMMAGTRGGLFCIDEAHNVLGHPDTVHLIQKLMREGRSLNVSQLYISQLVSDLLKVGGSGASLESYISRAFVLKMVDAAESRAALEHLIGYEPTQERVEMMRSFESRTLEDGSIQPSFGFHRDLKGRRSIVSFGPLGREFLAAASTNIDDRLARERAAVVANDAAAAAAVS